MKIFQFLPDVTGRFIVGAPENYMVAKAGVPEWYKKSERFYTSDMKSPDEIAESDKEEFGGLKTCVPFLDAMIHGYFYTTREDIYVNTTKENIVEIYAVQPDGTKIQESEMIGRRDPKSGALIPRPAGHAHEHLIWRNNLGFKTPRGYSTLLTHPLNRYDLPFTTMSGIIDSDKWQNPGNIPFFFKENIETIIPKGTPIVQLIPIKRNKWKHVVDNSYFVEKMYQDGVDVRSVKSGWYRDKFWIRKDFD